MVTEEILINKLKKKCSKAVAGKDVLVICDTSSINVSSQKERIIDFGGLGIIGRNQTEKSSIGYFLHPMLVMDMQDHSPYGLADVKLYNRSLEVSPLSRKEKKSAKCKKRIGQKESYRWLGPCLQARREALQSAERVTFVMDREADIWEVLEQIPGHKTHIVIRSRTNRCIIDPTGKRTKLYEHLASVAANGYVQMNLPKHNPKKKVTMALRYGRSQIVPSQFNNSDTPLSLSYVEIKEEQDCEDKHRKPVTWILWTDKEIHTTKQALEIINIYTKRWDIEVFFKLLKSDGYNIERSQMKSGKTLRKLTLILMEATLKVLQLKAARLGQTDLAVSDVFDNHEIVCLQKLNKQMQGKTKKQQNPYPIKHLGWASWIVARLGGWTEFYAKNKNPPGNKTLARGLDVFEAIMLGYKLQP